MTVTGVLGQKHKRRQPEEVPLNISVPPMFCYSAIKENLESCYKPGFLVTPYGLVIQLVPLQFD